MRLKLNCAKTTLHPEDLENALQWLEQQLGFDIELRRRLRKSVTQCLANNTKKRRCANQVKEASDVETVSKTLDKLASNFVDRPKRCTNLLLEISSWGFCSRHGNTVSALAQEVWQLARKTDRSLPPLPEYRKSNTQDSHSNAGSLDMSDPVLDQRDFQPHPKALSRLSAAEIHALLFEKCEMTFSNVPDWEKQDIGGEPQPENGVIYAWHVKDRYRRYVKIGFTRTSVEARMAKARQGCNMKPQFLWMSDLVDHPHRIEGLVHETLRLDRHVIPGCPCGLKHNEWFLFEKACG